MHRRTLRTSSPTESEGPTTRSTGDGQSHDPIWTGGTGLPGFSSVSDEPTPGRDPVAVAVVVLPALAAAVAVAFAATGTGLLPHGADIGEAAALGIRLGGVALAAGGVLALLTRWGRAARVAPRDLAAVLLTAAVAMAGVTALTFPASEAAYTPPDGGEATTTRASTTTTTEPTTTTTEQPDNGAPAAWDIDLIGLLALLVPVVLFVAVVGLLVFALAHLLGLTSHSAWRRGLRREGAPPVPGQAVALDAAAAEAGLEASLDAVTAEASPRDAISDAYARLLAALADAGAARRRHEAPHEHLDRVLTPLGVRSEPLHRLADLFVLARFSQHPVTTAHRDEASGALRAALADLREAEARRARPAPTDAPPAGTAR